MKPYKIFAIVLAAVFGILSAVWMLFLPEPQAAFKEPVTEEYYEILQKNAMEVAKTLNVDVLTDESLTAEFYYNDKELVVTVKSFKATVIAHLPLSGYDISIEDEELTFYGTVDFEKIDFEKSNELEPVWYYILLAIMVGCLIALVTYVIVYQIWYGK